jgi:hypothetical protein
LVPLKRTNF